MPGFPWLTTNKVDADGTAGKMRALRHVGVPYTDAEIAGAKAAVEGKTEQDALIAYLQGLGLASKTWKN
jgi:cytochrome c oxidase cbb3-type subunit 2